MKYLTLLMTFGLLSNDLHLLTHLLHVVTGAQDLISFFAF